MMGADPFSIAVLASGSGTNFQALLDRFHGRQGSRVRIGLLLASRPEIGALARATRAGVRSAILDIEREQAFLRDELRRAETDLVVLAGYLRLVPQEIVREYWGRMINIHPALLPAFGGEGMYGRRVHRAVLEAGVRVTGVTVHFVDERYDRGPIIAQWPVPVGEGDDPEALAARVLEVEHQLLVDVVEQLASGGVGLNEDGTLRRCENGQATKRFILSAGGERVSGEE